MDSSRQADVNAMTVDLYLEKLVKLGQLEIFADTLAISEIYLTVWAAYISNLNKISYT